MEEKREMSGRESGIVGEIRVWGVRKDLPSFLSSSNH